MRRAAVLLTFLAAACARGFPSPGGAALDGLALAGAPLSDGAAVAAVQPDGGPTRLTVRGAGLGGTEAIFVGGARAGGLSVRADAVDFDLPPPSAGAVGQAVPVLVSVGGVERTAGTLRLYLPPVITSVSTPVVAPGQVVIFGSGFSPIADDDHVDVAGTAAPVVLALSDRLVVDLPAGTPEGRRALTVAVAPASGLVNGPLATTAAPLVWKVISAFWVDPPQVFAGQPVSFRLPYPDGGNLAQVLDQATALSGSGTLDLSSGAADSDGGGAGPGGTSTGGGGATSGGSVSGGGATVDLDAGSLGAAYPPDAVAPPPTAAPTSGVVPAHAGLEVLRDGVDTGSRPLIDLNSYDLSWVIPQDTPVGAHQLALTTPAGSSLPAGVTVLAGHIAAPGLTCWPAAVPAGAQPAAQALHLAAQQGDLLLAAQDADALDALVVHPGGASELAQVPADALPQPSDGVWLAAAGRDLLYVSGHLQGGGFWLRAIERGAAPPEIFSLAADADLGGRALAVMEPNSRSVRTWVLVGGSAPALWDWSGQEVPLQMAPALPAGCAVSSAAAAPGAFTLAADCGGSGLYLGRLEVPEGDAVPGAATVAWSPVSLPAGDLQTATLTALASGQVLAALKGVNPGDSGLYLTDPAPTGGSTGPLGAVQLDPGTILAAALSPDGTQALAVHADDLSGQHWLQITARTAAGWRSGGSLPLDGAAAALGFDASGSQAALAVSPASGGAELCVLR